jgi:hypothetical protein
LKRREEKEETEGLDLEREGFEMERLEKDRWGGRA